MKPKRKMPSERSLAGSAGSRWPNEPRHVTAALWRFLLTLNGPGVGSGPCAEALDSHGFKGI